MTYKQGMSTRKKQAIPAKEMVRAQAQGQEPIRRGRFFITSEPIEHDRELEMIRHIQPCCVVHGSKNNTIGID